MRLTSNKPCRIEASRRPAENRGVALHRYGPSGIADIAAAIEVDLVVRNAPASPDLTCPRVAAYGHGHRRMPTGSQAAASESCWTRALNLS